MPIPDATWFAALIASRVSLSVVINAVDIEWLTRVMLYTPDIGDSVFPDITMSETGSHN